jgi:hypothetical protein
MPEILILPENKKIRVKGESKILGIFSEISDSRIPMR